MMIAKFGEVREVITLHNPIKRVNVVVLLKDFLTSPFQLPRTFVALFNQREGGGSGWSFRKGHESNGRRVNYALWD